MENPIKMVWFGGTIIFGNTHIQLISKVFFIANAGLHDDKSQAGVESPLQKSQAKQILGPFEAICARV